MTPKTLDINNNLWFYYLGEHAIKGKFGVHFDGQWRRSEFGPKWQQYLVRPGLNYHMSRDIMLTAGYTYAHTYPYGDSPVAHSFPEHRTYEQVQITKRVRGLTLMNRIRLEQRFVKYPRQESWTYQNRFRHMLRVEVPINSPDNPNRWYVPVYDEIFLGIPPNYGARTYDQNRLAVGVGKAFHGRWKGEVVYMNQFLGQRNGRIFEFNNTLVFSVLSTASFSSLWHH